MKPFRWAVGALAFLLVGCGTKNETGLPDFELEILRSFDRPLVFNVKTADEKVHLRTLIRGGRWGAETGQIEWDRTRDLDVATVRRLKTLLEAVNFSPFSDNSTAVRDGSQWTLIVKRWWPKRVTVVSPEVYEGSLDNAGLAALGAYVQAIADFDEKEKILRRGL